MSIVQRYTFLLLVQSLSFEMEIETIVFSIRHFPWVKIKNCEASSP